MDQHYDVHYFVAQAVRDGVLTKPDNCERCNAHVTLDGHHYAGYDGDHALDVRWLCRRCHVIEHPHVDVLIEGVESRYALMTPEARSEFMRNFWLALSPESRVKHSIGVKASWAVLSANERTDRVQAALIGQREKYTTPRRSNAAKRGWETRRANGNR